jgi:hypothetical protein
VGRKAGLSDEKLHAVRGDDMTPFNDTERLVIELADALTNTPSNVSDELYARLRNQFSEEQLMQLGGSHSKIIAPAGIEFSTSRATIFIKEERPPSRRNRTTARKRLLLAWKLPHESARAVATALCAVRAPKMRTPHRGVATTFVRWL